jgi:hypothetical protein
MCDHCVRSPATALALRSLLPIEIAGLNHEEILAIRHVENLWDQAGNPMSEFEVAIVLRTAIQDCESSVLEFPSILLRILRNLEQGRLRIRLNHSPA